MYDNDYIYHYGVKGMKWGVRKNSAGGLRGRATTAVLRRKMNASMEGPDMVSGKAKSLYNRTSRVGQFRVRKGINAINNLDKYKGKNLNKDKALRKEYYREMDDYLNTQMNAKASRWGNSWVTSIKFNYNTENSSTPSITLMNKANLKSRHDQRASAKTEYKELLSKSKAESKARKEKAKTVKHSDDAGEELVTLTAVLDENGFITDFVEQEMKHSDLKGFLIDHGVKEEYIKL